MMRTQTIGLVGAISVFAMLGGCTTSANGTPIPATQPAAPSETSSSPPSSADDTHGAPRVTDPLDANPFLADPCAILTPAQLADLSITRTAKPRLDGPSGPGCLWNSDADSGAIGVTFLTINKNGLSDTYRGRDQFEAFEPTTVAGYPAVLAQPADNRATGNCGIVVGISDTLTMLVLEQGQLNAEGACARATQAAAAAIATLKVGP